MCNEMNQNDAIYDYTASLLRISLNNDALMRKSQAAAYAQRHSSNPNSTKTKTRSFFESRAVLGFQKMICSGFLASGVGVERRGFSLTIRLGVADEVTDARLHSA